jgi:hypothetical protein
MPDIHGAEVGAGRVLIPHTMDNTYVTLVKQVSNGTHAGMQPQLIVKVQDLVIGDSHGGTVVPIKGVRVWYHRVEVVIASR